MLFMNYGMFIRLFVSFHLISLLTSCSDEQSLPKSPTIIKSSYNHEVDLSSSSEEQIAKRTDTKVSVDLRDNKFFINISMKNISGKELNISHGTQPYEIIVYDEQEKEVYRWSENKVFTMKLESSHFKQDEALNYQEIWDLVDREGHSVSSGHYRVEVIMLIGLTSHEELTIEEKSASIRFELD